MLIKGKGAFVCNSWHEGE